MIAARPDAAAVLRGLKDFQRDTAEYVFRRLYTDTDRTARFLIADEVGLGKTLVAKAVVALAIDHLWDTTKRIDILYVCSNSDIARQNINRLNILPESQFTMASRITLLPARLQALQGNRLNFVSLTPGTSFELKSSLGLMEERALLHCLLNRAWGLSGTASLNVLQGHASVDNFRSLVDRYPSDYPIEPSVADAFEAALARQPDIKGRFDDLCAAFSRVRKNIPPEEESARKTLIGELRDLLAATCLQSLEPDLVILDEFQRFKHLLDGQDPASGLARRLFEYPDVRVLLLSATPYKMYTLADEAGIDNHYEDFVRTLRFLQQDDAKSAAFEKRISDFRGRLFHVDEGWLDGVRVTKEAIETDLRQVIARTERLAVTENRDGMLTEIPAGSATLDSRDLDAYLALQRVARTVDQADTLEYWKSAPYLLNFMDEYELKRAVKQAAEDPKRKAALVAALRQARAALLPWADISRYAEIDPGNARLRSLIAGTLDVGTWQLLWIPPSLPYYAGSGPFAHPAAQRFTKRLVFSAWRFVPRVIATLVSYEAERRMMRSLEESPENTPEARRRRTQLLRFSRADDRLSGMPVLGLMYPCVTLAAIGDPLQAAVRHASEALPTETDVLDAVERELAPLLGQLPAPSASTGEVDESWYWAAPILLDHLRAPAATSAWFGRPTLATMWSGAEAGGRTSDDDSAWADHVRKAASVIDDPGQLGPRPSDLSRVLAKLAVAAPGVSALRALQRVCDGASGANADPALRDCAAQIAWGFRSLFNSPEVIAVVRGLNREEPYWLRCVEYCSAGNLQSSLDEYFHILRESLGLIDKTPEKVAGSVADAVLSALSLRTVTLAVDDLVVGESAQQVIFDTRRLRARFALRLGDDQVEGSEEATREDQVRQAFNSPFWPFILATTSVGQEGLDFHPYSHAVVHWNLPSNPVDLEQREGRVHRYKGHAVRRNLARRFGPELRHLDSPDPWSWLFTRASRERGTASDLIPFWVYPLEGGATIERHVPSVPLSREIQRLTLLRRSLAVYRMIFGQPRQEDLMDYLTTRFSAGELSHLAGELRVDLSPPRPA